jgi:hypothetical protein
MKKLILIAALALIPSWANAQSVPSKYDSTASTNSTLVAPGYSQLKLIVAINSTVTLYYLKFYDKVTAPACNTDTVVFKVPVPFGAANAGGGMVIAMPDGLQFFKGIGFCLTGAAADNDNTNAATGVTINLGVKQ